MCPVENVNMNKGELFHIIDQEIIRLKKIAARGTIPLVGTQSGIAALNELKVKIEELLEQVPQS